MKQQEKGKPKKTAVVLTCHNRREKTLACVRSLLKGAEDKLHFIIVDSGSTDGTKEALGRLSCSMELLCCPNDYFWNAGMRAGLGLALEKKESFDHCLLVNDDVEFYPGAFSMLLQTLGAAEGVCIGAVQDGSGRQSYGAVKKKSAHFAGFSLIPPGSDETPDTFNGNCLLMPVALLERFGPPDPRYVHSMADFDYGLFLSGKGVPLIQTKDFVGRCEDNPREGSWRDPKLPVLARIRKKESVKGLPAGDWFYFVKKNYGLLPALYHSATPYVRILLDAFGPYLMAFLLPILLYSAALFVNGVFPFGQKLWYDGDLQDQFVSFYGYLHEALHGNASMLYSFSKVMGGGMIDMLAYYLANPLLLLFYFFDRHSMPEAVLTLSWLSLGLCGVSAFTCFKRHSDRIFSLALSCAYALCAGILLYHTKFMWVPGFILLPQMILGIEELFSKKRIRYFLSLTGTLIFGYYIGFMLCITSVLFFFLCCFPGKREMLPGGAPGAFRGAGGYRLGVLKDYVVISLSAGLSSAFMLLPGILGLRGAKLEMVSLSGFLELTPRFPPHWLLFPLLPFSFREEMLGSVQPPLLYCGLLPAILAVSFFFTSVEKRKKLGFGLLLLILFLSTICVGPYQFWHGGAYPAGFETRFSFIFSFFLLYLAGKAFRLNQWMKKIRLFKGLSVFWIYAALLVNAVFSLSVLHYSDVDSFQENIAFLDQAEAAFPASVRERGERVALGAGRTLNAGWTYNLPSMSSYTSNETFELRYYLQHAGLSGNLAWTSYSFGETQPAAEDLFGIRYILLTESAQPRPGWRLLARWENGVIYENPYALPFAFFADPAAESIPEVTTSEYASEDPEVIENALWNGLYPGAGEVFRNQELRHRASERLQQGAPEVSFSAWDRFRLSGVSPGEERVLVIMLPEESASWQITMGGKLLRSETVLGLFTGLRLPAGPFSVEMRYTPRGLTEGILLSLFGFLLFLCYNRRREKEG